MVWLSGPILVGKGRAVPPPVVSKARTLYCGEAWGVARAARGSCRCLHAPPRGVARQGGGAEKIGENWAQKGHISAMRRPIGVIFLLACRKSDSCQNDVWVEGAKPHPPS